MKNKILITAFMPFAGRRQNPALEVMTQLRTADFKNCRLYKEKLPVSGEVIGRKIAGLISTIKPDCAISLGLAAAACTLWCKPTVLTSAPTGFCSLEAVGTGF